MEDKLLTCKDCGKNFVFTVSEQEFFAGKGFKYAPSRCPECRQARKNKQNEAGFNRGSFNQYSQDRSTRETYEAVCAECGCTTEVPFKPKEDRPVYCRQCYVKRKQKY